MFLTRFPLNLSRREARSMLANPYRIHAAVSASFPPSRGGESDGDGRILWRIDKNPSGEMDLYIVSPGKPSLVGLDEQIGWPDLDHQWETRPYDGFLGALENGQCWTFRLVANPVVSRGKMKDEHGRSKRVGHLTVLQQEAWLVGKDAYKGVQDNIPELFAGAGSSRAERNGFRVTADPKSGLLNIVVSDSRKLSFKGGAGNRITLTTARYDGVLEVTDAAALRHALINGIGHAKGFGCGLMTLAPVRS